MSGCKWAGSDRPRIVTGRHGDDCNGETCSGCQPCTEPHCVVCTIVHADGACAECLASVRSDLHEIGERCHALPDEVEHRGINSEAAMLWGPTADPEARQHVEGSYLAGRLPEGWIEATHGKECPLAYNEPCVGCAGDELHPLAVLGTWQMLYQDALDHDDDSRLTVAGAIGYLDRNLTYIAGYEHVPFEDMARDLRRCVAHLGRVMHDQNDGDRANVGCFDCGGDLERRLTTGGFEDFWTCGKCRRRYKQAEYNFALSAAIQDALEEEPA